MVFSYRYLYFSLSDEEDSRFIAKYLYIDIFLLITRGSLSVNISNGKATITVRRYHYQLPQCKLKKQINPTQNIWTRLHSWTMEHGEFKF